MMRATITTTLLITATVAGLTAGASGATPASRPTIHGTSAGETINGTPRDDRIYAHEGDDVVYGDHGYDNLYGNEGNDTLYGDDGQDSLYGGRGKDRLVERFDNIRDYLNGGPGSDIVIGSRPDVSRGDDGDDTLRGKGTLRGGNGDDTLRTNGPAKLFGGPGVDRLWVGRDAHAGVHLKDGRRDYLRCEYVVGEPKPCVILDRDKRDKVVYLAVEAPDAS